MKDVEKTSVERKSSGKRLRRRRRMWNVYVLLVVLLALAIGTAISYTFLFNISEIRVSGESDMYTAQQIVEASQIHEGDNLLRLDTDKSEKRILDSLLYVETAEVKRNFPSTLEITVTRCIPAFNVQYDSGVFVVSQKGKILEDNSFITDGLPVIYGLEPNELSTGKVIGSDNERKNTAFFSLINSISHSENYAIDSVDISDEYSIVVNYSNGLIFRMGNWNDIEYKLSLASNIMNDETVRGKKGYLTMIGTNQCSFRTTDEPIEMPGIIEPSTEPKTDANGNQKNEEVHAEANPEQADIFKDFNSRVGEGTESDTQPQTEESTEDDTYSEQNDWDYSDESDQNDWNDNSSEWDYSDQNQWSDDSYNDWDYSDQSQWSDDSYNDWGYSDENNW